MAYSSRRRLIPEAEAVVTGSLVELYPCDLQLYTLPPTFSISLAEFEELAQERLTLLRTVELVNLKGLNKSYDEYKIALIAELKKQGLNGYAKLINGAGCGTSEAELQVRKRDHISHFILRLAYCKSEDLRQWFISKELDLFKVRFNSLNAEGIKCFMNTNKLKYESIPQKEKSEIEECLYESSLLLASTTSVEAHEFYKVPFTEVQDLIKNRKVYVKSGFAYVPSTDLISVLSAVFRTNLAHGIAMTASKLPYLEGDERVFHLLKDLHHSYTGEEYMGTKHNADGKINIDDIDMLARRSFPPCMRQLHEHFRANHHLRHGGRMQYALFLKGIGVTLEDCLRMWREEFTKKIDTDKFEKQYAYSIRHNYGQEGKRANYTPYSCMKIIMSTVGPDDVHGCPFKHNDVANLKEKMLSWSIPVSGISEVAEYATQGHYQVACGKYFQLSHGPDADVAINHPNQYFIESQAVLAGKGGTDSDQTVSGVSANTTPKTKPQPVKPKIETEDVWGEDMDIVL